MGGDRRLVNIINSPLVPGENILQKWGISTCKKQAKKIFKKIENMLQKTSLGCLSY